MLFKQEESLSDLLMFDTQEAAFRKVVQATMVRDRQHGPVIEINRIQVKHVRVRLGTEILHKLCYQCAMCIDK